MHCLIRETNFGRAAVCGALSILQWPPRAEALPRRVGVDGATDPGAGTAPNGHEGLSSFTKCVYTIVEND